MVSMTGVPTVKLGTKLKFFNEDAALDVYHTATSCGFPCTGATGTSFPLANGTTSAGRKLDFDSAELGYGVPLIGPARQSFDWDLDVSQQTGYQAGEIVTYYCRIHPGMRGAFEVTN
jgi:plastocyanin